MLYVEHNVYNYSLEHEGGHRVLLSQKCPAFLYFFYLFIFILFFYRCSCNYSCLVHLKQNEAQSACVQNQQQTRELISARKTSHKYNNKVLNRLR